MPQQRWLRVIPVAFIMYTISYIDRTNISLALPSMSLDLHMNSSQAGGAAGVFFWGYLLLQIPGGHLAERWSAKRFVSILIVVWGLCAVGCGLVQTWHEFWVMRFLLGVAEGGVWPATLVLLSHWFPRAERARANAFWMLCLPVAVVVSSPLSGWILAHWSWRVLLVVEGVLPLAWLVIWLAQIEDYPHQARWISDEERQALETSLRREAADSGAPVVEPFRRALLRWQVCLMVGVYFLLTSGSYGYLFWLPTALEGAKKLSPQLVGILFSVPYVLTGIAMVANARHSDQRHERRRHVAAALAWGGVFLLAAVSTSRASPWLAFLFICLAGAGPYAALGPFWAIPTETLPPGVAGPAMGFVNAVGNLGGYFGPLVVGYLNKLSGNFVYGFGVLSLGLLVGSLASSALPRARVTEEAAQAAGSG